MPIPMPYMNGMEGWDSFCFFACLLEVFAAREKFKTHRLSFCIPPIQITWSGLVVAGRLVPHRLETAAEDGKLKVYTGVIF